MVWPVCCRAVTTASLYGLSEILTGNFHGKYSTKLVSSKLMSKTGFRVANDTHRARRKRKFISQITIDLFFHRIDDDDDAGCISFMANMIYSIANDRLIYCNLSSRIHMFIISFFPTHFTEKLRRR